MSKDQGTRSLHGQEIPKSGLSQSFQSKDMSLTDSVNVSSECLHGLRRYFEQRFPEKILFFRKFHSAPSDKLSKRAVM